ncbi:MAG: hypothetical protein KBI47_02885 [Armatimonadetes bacterium]|nr:hypothetical protein [Armatimonadota bacterium]
MKSPSPLKLSPVLVWPVTVLASGAGIGAAALLAMRLLPRGHADVWEWKLRTDPVPPLPWTLPAALVLLVLVMVTLDALRAGATPSRGRCVLLVILLTLGSGALMMSLAVDDREYPYRASAALLADMTMGYYLEATRVDSPRDWVSDVERRTSRAFVPERVATHPPGPTLYFSLARKYLLSHPQTLDRLATAYDRWSGDKQQQASVALARRVATFGPEARDVVIAFWAGLLLTLTAPLVTPLAFGLGTLAGGPRLGLTAATIATAIPSLQCFNPSVDGFISVLACGAVVCWLWCLRRGGWTLPALLAGVLWSVGLFWSFGVASLAAVMGVQGIMIWRDAGRSGLPCKAGLGLLAGVLAPILVWYIALGYNPVVNFALSMATQGEIMVQRPAGLSIVWNLYDFALLAGPSLILAAIAGVLFSLSPSLRPRVVAAVGLSVVVTLLVLALSARTRGEVGRIWALLMPPLTVPAAVPALGLRGWGLIAAGMLIVIGQLAVTIVVNSQLLLVAP